MSQSLRIAQQQNKRLPRDTFTTEIEYLQNYVCARVCV